jgi:hypothetical protein
MRRWIAILCLICAPSAFVAWHRRDIPQLGFLADDAIYLVSAKSLATGQGYRILSLPGAPAMTKYPPAYPLLLSLVWRINPRFPDNLPWAALLAWLMVPLLLIMARLAFIRMGIRPGHAILLCGLMALSGPMVRFGINLMPELVFTSVLLASTILADSGDNGWCTAGAALLGGVAYLLKSAALPLLVTSPLLYLLRRRYRSAALFSAAMLPFVAGWMWWVHANRPRPGDSTWTFYTDYFAYQAQNVALREYPHLVWVNLKTLFSSMGGLIAAPVFGKPLGRLPAYAGAAIALAGAALLARRKGVTHYHAFALGFVPLLLIWHYPPLPRFVFPLMPLLLAGIFTAGLEAWRTFTERQRGVRRLAALSTLAVLGALIPLAALTTYVRPLAVFYRQTDTERGLRDALLPEYRWIQASIRPEAAFVATSDAVLYLYTGHPAMALHIPPKLSYHKDRPGMAREYREIDAFAARNRLSYLLRTPADFEQDFEPDLGRTIVDGLLADPQRFRLLNSIQGAAVYEVVWDGAALGKLR